MGFDVKSDNDHDQNQLSLFEMPSMNFIEAEKSQTQAAPVAAPAVQSSKSSNALDYQAWAMAHSEPEQSKTSKFMTMSMALHAAAILGIAVMSVPLVEQAKTETITIEIEDTPAPRLQARGAKVPPTQGGTPVVEEKPAPAAPAKPAVAAAEAGGPGDVLVAAKTAKHPKMAKAAKAAVAKSPKAKIAGAKASARSIAPKTQIKAVPMSIDDIDAPSLDEGELAKNPVRSDMNEDFNEDFANIDRSHKKAIAQEKADMDAMANALAAEQDDELKSIEDKNKEDAARFAALQQDMRKNNAKAIASAIASERASAAAAARAAADQEARENAARLAAANAAKAKSGLGGSGNGHGRGTGAGAGNNGSSDVGTQVAGNPKGVRSLDQLRQMPGNPRPQYDREERRRGDQGEVAFVAWVTKDGHVTKFRQMKSTGYQNLDSKTLEALKRWRFYPGQEGWVELPFRWDLKGGVQQDGGRLRTSVSQN
ncbi:energy transducer TonB [Bdellovibrio sp. NC01]|uniref:energy transducer TonB n=1 Tax=Bdellovibrio sp. NC01 TaxID=2220073 RepID=UPI00115A516E|nr:energy transducer TonB [Bdellovibrio sp. NC01]QDK39445.1 hypothetical protein DOE51_18500 [Bdellovibrio sp. NC01]